MDDADKYDFADNYQQTDDDVSSDQISDKQYVQEQLPYEKSSDDVYEDEGQVQTDDRNADEYD